MSKLTYTTQQRGDELVFFLAGKIDEDFRNKDIVTNNAKKIVFNFKDLTMINSCGVREWIEFIKSQSSDIQICYEECTPIVVTQMNLISGFLPPHAKVLSFYAPYFDPSDESESLHLIKVDQSELKLPPIVKNQKGDPLEFDAHPEKYFVFLKKQGTH